MTLWRLHVRIGPGTWEDLVPTYEGSHADVVEHCRELADELGQPVNAVSIDEPEHESIALAS